MTTCINGDHGHAYETKNVDQKRLSNIMFPSPSLFSLPINNMSIDHGATQL
jgi:hypothetical protein